MRRLALLFSMLVFAALAAPVQALPGFEPNQLPFEIQVRVFNEARTQRFIDVTPFNPATGWDGGDRDGYFCGWVEHFTQGLDFTIDYAVYTDETGGYGGVINDRNITEGQQGGCGRVNHQIGGVIAPGFVCGDLCLATYNGEDHFPHGVSLVFYRSGAEFDRVDYPTQCGQTYWTDGNEPGEVVFWWDEDGAADMLMHEDGLCGGGPGEPQPVVRGIASHLAVGVTVCTEGSDGTSSCTGEAAVPPSPEPVPEPVPEPTSTDPRCVQHPNDSRCLS